MRSVKYFALAVLTLGLAAGLGAYRAAFEDKPKYTIEEVMEKAHEGDKSLMKKIVAGKGSKEEKEQLLEMYVALTKNKPPKGDDKSWKEKTEALVAAAKAVLADEAGADAKLKKAATCAACHKVHKGDD
jgi:hypothetical protein